MKASEIEKSVFKITSETLSKSYARPWEFGVRSAAVGTGFCISISGGKFIVTNTHVVENAVVVYAGDELEECVVEYSLPECDLAVLKPKNKSFLKKVVPLVVGGMPGKGETVMTYGYPLGGVNISVTRGVISRIEIIKYMRITEGIAIQTDAAINSGNSGGPVVNKKGVVVGVAFAGVDGVGVQNVGFMIPTSLLRFAFKKFEKNLKRKVSEENLGLCTFGLSTQGVVNASMKQFLSLKSSESGVLVNRVNERYGYKIEPGDVVMSVNGVSVSSEGLVKISDLMIDRDEYFKKNVSEMGILTESNEVVSFENFATLSVRGEKMRLGVMRNGKEKLVEVELRNKKFPVPVDGYQAGNGYYIIAGMVFVPLSVMLLREMHEKGEYIDNLLGFVQSERPRVVLVAVFPNEAVKGYSRNPRVLDAVNGIAVEKIEDLKNILNDPKKKLKFAVFQYDDTDEIDVLSMDAVEKYDKVVMREMVGEIPKFRI